MEPAARLPLQYVQRYPALFSPLRHPARQYEAGEVRREADAGGAELLQLEEDH